MKKHLNGGEIIVKEDAYMNLDGYYQCYLNGNFYGGGNLDYMHELFKDYVLTCGMYGRKTCEFKIVKVE